MRYEFLKQFDHRMKNVGLYCALFRNSFMKETWTKYGVVKSDEQFNIIFALMLYLMEQSLKEENCTMDDIAVFLDNLNSEYFHKKLSYAECKELGDFIVNTILSNDGKVMSFDGFSFERNAYKMMNISYVANRAVYVNSDVRRATYHLTDDGYDLLLGTLEMENNMKLTIHEMIFQLHLEKQSYDKAEDEIKNVFNLLRIQVQKIQEAMLKIRRNPLRYTTEDYQSILRDDLETISDTKRKFQDFRQIVKARANELEEQNINIRSLSSEDTEKLGHLKVIGSFLSRVLDEYQKILGEHFDLKTLYGRELEAMTRMSLIKRFSLRTELYDPVLENAETLSRLDLFLRPLFSDELPKTYNPAISMTLQKPSRVRGEEESTELIDFDEEAWEAEQERLREKKAREYKGCLTYILKSASLEENGEITLESIAGRFARDNQGCQKLIPNVEVFKEVMVELLRNKEISLALLRKERSQYIQERVSGFQLNETLLEIADSLPEEERFRKVFCCRIENGKTVEFQAPSDTGSVIIRCSDVLIRVAGGKFVKREENENVL